MSSSIWFFKTFLIFKRCILFLFHLLLYISCLVVIRIWFIISSFDFPPNMIDFISITTGFVIKVFNQISNSDHKFLTLGQPLVLNLGGVRLK